MVLSLELAAETDGLGSRRGDVYTSKVLSEAPSTEDTYDFFIGPVREGVAKLEESLWQPSGVLETFSRTMVW